MSTSEALRHLLEERELALAAALTAVAVVAMVLAGHRRPVLVLGAVMALVGAQHPLEAIGILGIAVLLDAVPQHAWAARPVEALLTPIAAAAIYLCTPDTERSIVLLGVLTVLSPMAVALRIPWPGVAAGATMLMAWISVADGRGRGSAVVAALAIALVHAGGQRVLRHRPSLATQVATAVVGTVAVLALSRWAGLVPDLPTALWRTSLTVLLASGTPALLAQRGRAV